MYGDVTKIGALTSILIIV